MDLIFPWVDGTLPLCLAPSSEPPTRSVTRLLFINATCESSQALLGFPIRRRRLLSVKLGDNYGRGLVSVVSVGGREERSPNGMILMYDLIWVVI